MGRKLVFNLDSNVMDVLGQIQTEVLTRDQLAGDVISSIGWDGMVV